MTPPRYESIAESLEAEISAGRLRPGDRLPAVRALAKELGVSAATVAAAYAALRRRGRTRGSVGQGTIVATPPPPTPLAPAAPLEGGAPGAIPWRRRALLTSVARLRAAHPRAVDCATGLPDARLFPLAVLKRAWHAAIDATHAADLQYAGPEPVAELARQLLPRFEADGVPAREGDLVVGSSAQQLMALALEVAASLAGRTARVVAVEEPGFYAAFDTFERAGFQLVGVEVDSEGAIPASLEAALRRGPATPCAVLLTPRAHNPTGASWTAARAGALADVLATHPSVVAIEDDSVAAPASRSGSLLADARLENRVVYIRTFAKAIAPDLRIAVAVARSRLRALLAETKSFADGWSSRLAQRALGRMLADDELDAALDATRRAHATRRAAAIRGLASLAPEGGPAPAVDGANIWVHLPPGTDAAAVVEQAARLGVLIASGEPFFIRPGRSDAVRLNVAEVSAAQAAEIGQVVATAALTATSVDSTAASV